MILSSHRHWGQILLCCGLVPLLAATAGCQKSRMLTGGVRAIWVTRGDFRTAEDIRQIMEDSQQGGFNTVIFQVRGNGTVFYPSRIEPWAEQFGFQDPGFDPLAAAIREAHRRGLELHAWMNVMPAWRGTSPPQCPDQLYHRHPEWFWYDQHGKRQALSTFYVSLNPCLPEVRDYLVRVFSEVVANYPVDGIHMDYIRFPNEPPATPARSDIDYPYDARTLALYKEATGLSPDADREAWNRWRTGQVTRLVAGIRATMRQARPSAVLSASVGAEHEESLRYFRDDRCWAREKLIDAAFPMAYRPDLASFDARISEWVALRDTVTVVPGLWFAPALDTDQGIAVVRQQLASSLQKTGNACVFSYASLFDIRDNRDRFGEENRPRAEEAAARTRREARRKALLPVTQFVPSGAAG
jgi:uncharacterized lipoprotein YddW (UPF0748 family)